jgi:branched-chain amino acid aminotransferase
VCFLDAAEQRWVEELGGMNIFFVHRDGRLVTPELTGSILEGVTRSSILALAEEEGLDCEERKVSIDEWRDGVASGQITEVFACGTAAVITPVAQLVWDGGSVGDPDGPAGALTMRIRQALVDIQYGRTPDTHGWLRRLA